MHLHSMRKHLMRLHKILAHGTLGAVSEVTEAVDAWREIAKQVANVSCRLDKALGDGYGLGMSEFEILDRLAESEESSLRMHELSLAVHLTQSALSRAVARLEKDGLVKREMCTEDRRVVYVGLTKPGKQRWELAWPIHRKVVCEVFGHEPASDLPASNLPASNPPGIVCD
jgi:DNA-binding MarR family transcriptional regulator